MGLFDAVLGNLLGNHPQAGPLQSVLGSILGGSQQAGGGGLPQLINQFTQAGLGNVIGSWIGTGANQQVGPQQLQNVFGRDQVSQWSQQTGMPQENLLQELSRLLPHAVDQATPNGEIPSSPFDAPGLELPQR